LIQTIEATNGVGHSALEKEKFSLSKKEVKSTKRTNPHVLQLENHLSSFALDKLETLFECVSSCAVTTLLSSSKRVISCAAG